MSSVPIMDQQCFYVVIFVFLVGGFYRGWKRETISLIFILLGAFLVRPNSNQDFGQYIQRVPQIFSYLFTGKVSPTPATTSGLNFGPLGTLLVFALIVALGYVIGNRAFPKPATPAERFIGIVPALISGAAVLYYVDTSGFFVRNAQGQASISTVVMLPDPSQYVPIIITIAIIALIIALIASRTRKSAPPAKK